MMKNKLAICFLGGLVLLFLLAGCKSINQNTHQEISSTPATYNGSRDTINAAEVHWKQYFDDVNLIALIDSALINNQELNILLQEIEISKNEIRVRKGEYLPFVNLGIGSGLEKEGRYTRHGAVDDQIDIKPGTSFPEPLTDYQMGIYASWEIDVWKKLRNAKKSALLNYLASIEGRNFMVTNLVAEMSEAYYELMALDNFLEIIEKNVLVQSNALKVVQLQKDAARVSQLAVNRFEAQLLNTQNLQYAVKQHIKETENRINFLVGRFPGPIKRSSDLFINLSLDSLQVGLPSDLLWNRPDIRQAEFKLSASKFDVKVARANFFPSFGIKAGVGYQAFNPMFLLDPKSLLYNFAGELMSPLINRNAIKAAYKSANSKQLQAVFHYNQTLLTAYLDVSNQLAKLENYSKSFETKRNEVIILNNSITIANALFNSAKANYGEVLLTQREALEARMDLIDIRSKQLNAKVNIYRALGGGWN